MLDSSADGSTLDMLLQPDPDDLARVPREFGQD